MNQFWAMLKDSYREAVDGFVIYGMFVLSAVLIVIAVSMSFTPAPPEKAFETIAQSLTYVTTADGRGRMTTGSTQLQVSDVRPEVGGYKFRLTVHAQAPMQRFENGRMVADQAGGDSFRQLVATWMTMRQNGGDAFRSISDAEQRAVTDTQMEEFIRSQLADRAGVRATVTRVTAGIEFPTYAFDLATTGDSSVRGWPHTTRIFFGAATLDDETPLGGMLWAIEDVVINRIGGTLILLLAMIITSSFIPNMLRKGSVDLLISKPIARPQLLVYKYLGGLTFVLLVTTALVGGIWLALAVRSGYWDTGFLWTIPILTFTFAVLYALATLVAVITRSSSAAMLVATGFAFFLFIVGQIKSESEGRQLRRPNEPRSEWGAVIDNLHDLMPRYRDLGLLNRHVIAEGKIPPELYRMAVRSTGEPPPVGEVVGVSTAWIVVLVGFACWFFKTRDY